MQFFFISGNPLIEIIGNTGCYTLRITEKKEIQKCEDFNKINKNILFETVKYVTFMQKSLYVYLVPRGENNFIK